MHPKRSASFILCLSLAACAPAAPGGGPSSSSSAVPERYVSSDCRIGGCSGEVCGDAGGEPIVSNCISNPAFSCYKTARCEKQADGACGWTMTSELSACLFDPPEEDPSSISA
jgi:hypothetical protein